MTGWAEGMSGWRPEFGVAEELLPTRWEVLAGLVGRSVVGWTIWDQTQERWYGVGPLVLVADGPAGRVQVEIGWQRWDDLSITVGTVDLTIPPEVGGRAAQWRAAEPAAVAAIEGRAVTGFAAVEVPYFDGETDLRAGLPMDQVAGWVLNGLWIEFGTGGLYVHNGIDENGYSSVVETPSRVRRLG
ncbi:hypothetical protein Q0Z83_003500 [Actinoplanes sichuanensis]|uniref:DUF4178 domain-containing protein n=1 Tax=Actinoplanes sichuanensis TaxID=512349 RepID=A0ABW4AGJ5_9ACTN|nr:hypothetical protein [Actinoplanes sichuanensis]BEL02159.1 hypothetical protein Q0Z83_003500 [Actinoplanes sichuanensis]